tara:strand:+ start:3405 stop:3611 length:207 start_codon:yes stop_codon:yes gene_type:complete
MPDEKRPKLIGLLRDIDRMDLYGVKERKKYWATEEEPTCQGCVDFLINLYPEKKIFERVIHGEDPYED